MVLSDPMQYSDGKINHSNGREFNEKTVHKGLGDDEGINKGS